MGGAIAHSLQLPLAWMIGAMTATTIAALSGLTIRLPQELRNTMVIVLGVMLGSSFSPEILDRALAWSVSLLGLLVYVFVAAAVGRMIFQRFAGYDPTTAYFCAVPGGLSEMTLVGSALGGDARIISLTHASRLLLVVFIVPFAFRLFGGLEPSARAAVDAGAGTLTLQDFLLLAGCGIVGFFLAKALRAPAASILGPMILSAIAHLAGLTEAAPPSFLVNASQVVIGSAIGCRFAGFALRQVGRALAFASLGTAVLLSLTITIVALLGLLTPFDFRTLVLAFSPGGLAEMSLIAIALKLDAAFVATHHIVRIFIIVVGAPLLLRLARSGRRA